MRKVINRIVDRIADRVIERVAHLMDERAFSSIGKGALDARHSCSIASRNNDKPPAEGSDEPE